LLLSRLCKFVRLPLVEKLLLLEAALHMAPARLAVLWLPFRMIAPLLGRQRCESPLEVAPKQEHTAQLIGAAVTTISRHSFWRSTCLVQAVAAQLMLKRRGIPATLYLGTARDMEKHLLAHSWVRCGHEILTGAAGHERFTIVASFSPRSPSNRK
jgi:hypothetical protein